MSAKDKARYNVYLWWGQTKRRPDGWKLRFRNVRLWALRRRLRVLYRESWGPVSILVERSDPEYHREVHHALATACANQQAICPDPIILTGNFAHMKSLDA